VSNPTDPIKPSSRREVVLFEQAYQQGANDMYAAMRASFRREVWRIKHPIRYAFHRSPLGCAATRSTPSIPA